MKILHLGDLHIGKKVNGISMLDEQKYVFSQALELVLEKNIKAVLISGDVFDKQIASISALEVFEEFINKLCEKSVKIFIIPGNHDNMERLAFLSSLLRKSCVYISKAFFGSIEKIELDSNINIFLMPYLYPALVRKFYPEIKISDYNDAIKVLLQNTKLEDDKINILLAHQFVVGSDDMILSDSETKSVGGVDAVSFEHFKKFDYTALGHLHCPQQAGSANIRYSGSILKYSFSEINQKKVFTIADIESKNNINFEFIDIKSLHELKHYKGYLSEFLNKEFISKVRVDDYIYFTLFDENVIDAKRKLTSIYPNIMLLDFDNSFTRNLSSAFDVAISKNKSMFEHFSDFYQVQTGSILNDEQTNIVASVVNQIREGS